MQPGLCCDCEKTSLQKPGFRQKLFSETHRQKKRASTPPLGRGGKNGPWSDEGRVHSIALSCEERRYVNRFQGQEHRRVRKALREAPRWFPDTFLSMQCVLGPIPLQDTVGAFEANLKDDYERVSRAVPNTLGRRYAMVGNEPDLRPSQGLWGWSMRGGETGRGQAVASGQSPGGFRGVGVGPQVGSLRLVEGRLGRHRGKVSPAHTRSYAPARRSELLG
jgi:hypothetical protein